MRSVRRLQLALLLAWIGGAPALAQPQGAVTTSLTVKGSVEREITLSVDDLKRLPVQRMDDVRSVRDTSGAAPSAESARDYVGYLLRDVLERAKPVEKKRLDFRKSAVIATARRSTTATGASRWCHSRTRDQVRATSSGCNRSSCARWNRCEFSRTCMADRSE